METVNIIGAGLAGLSAAMTLAGKGIKVRLISSQVSERAQSNLAEGGINAALNVMGENDTIAGHFEDTMRGGVYLANPDMVHALTEAAPGIIRQMDALGVPFHREGGHIVQRSFGGQKKKRTAYAKASTGKVLMQALIDEVRRYEAKGLVTRFSHHVFTEPLINGNICEGVGIYDSYNGSRNAVYGKVIMATGGFNGMFPGLSTGSTANTGSAAAALFCGGVPFANLEFIQYHPTTCAIAGKRLLISEAARGEGGRLFTCDENGTRHYFMEDKYGEGGNLMPRDVISREMAALDNAYLDMTQIPKATWDNTLSDLRREIIHFLAVDPAAAPVPVSPGIHYFMGGIKVDRFHRTDINYLYAAGECACAYHGANRLGGNSLLGAVFGGITAAESAAGEPFHGRTDMCQMMAGNDYFMTRDEKPLNEAIGNALSYGMTIIKDEKRLVAALEEIAKLRAGSSDMSEELSDRMIFARAILESSLMRKESRGAHVRSDYPDTVDEFAKTTVADYDDGDIRITYEKNTAC